MTKEELFTRYYAAAVNALLTKGDVEHARLCEKAAVWADEMIRHHMTRKVIPKKAKKPVKKPVVKKKAKRKTY